MTDKEQLIAILQEHIIMNKEAFMEEISKVSIPTLKILLKRMTEDCTKGSDCPCYIAGWENAQE